MDGNGHVRIAGLSTAFIPSIVPAVQDVDRSFHGTASELIDAQRWGFTGIGVAAASDVYAFATLAWEVRTVSVASLDKPLNREWFLVRLSLGNLCSLRGALSQGSTQCRMDVNRLDLITLSFLIVCGR